MKKVSIILMLLMALFMPYAASAYNHQVFVGDESSTTGSNFAPFNTNANYSYVQMIYTAAQINDDCAYDGYIESISFYALRPSQVTTVPITVYMKTTQNSSFSTTRAWESVTANDIVYDGDVNTDFGENTFEGWVTITFDQPFAYDGTSNLLIAINKGHYIMTRDNRWQNTTVTGNQVLYVHNGNNSTAGTPYNPYSMGSTYGTRTTRLPNIIFNMTLNHPFPTNVTLDDASGSTATISWTAPQTTNTITNYAYEYTNGTTTWNGTTNSTTLNLSNLTAETDYQFQVKAVYSDGESCWSTLDFSSLEDCPTPINLTASNITSHSADISWIGSGADSYTVQLGSMGNTSSNETVLSEGFEYGDMPEGWTTITGDWEIDDYYDAATGRFYAENYNDPDILITPAMDLSAASSATLSFNFLNIATEYDVFVLNVYYRVNGGDWNLLYTNGNEYDDWESIEINLTGMAANYQIGFECTINEDYGDTMGIDDVEIVAEVSQITWTTVDDNASKPFTVDDLTPETTYRVRVLSVCGGVPGEPSAPLSFVTLPLQPITKHIDGYHGNDGGYYLIASPVAEPITPTTENGFITNEYDLYAFDESKQLEWLNFEAQSFTQLVSGRGYLYASENDTELTFVGTPYNGDGKVRLQKTAGAEFEGWNLVGNPFNESAYLVDRPYYRSNGAEVLDVLETGVIERMEGVFVIAEQDEDEITFSTTAPNRKIAKLSVDLTRNNSLLDRAIVRFDEGRQLPKFQLRKNSSKVFIPLEGNDYAVIRSKEIGAMPINFKAEYNGTYALSFTTDEVSFAYLHLIDNMTGNDVDLLANPSYSFNAKSTDYESRFKLVFATGHNSTDDNFAFFCNGSFVINNEGEATLQVFDINGRILNTESINGCANIEVNAASGIYMLRLVNGNDVKVQKVVVR